MAFYHTHYVYVKQPTYNKVFCDKKTPIPKKPPIDPKEEEAKQYISLTKIYKAELRKEKKYEKYYEISEKVI